MDRGRGHRCPGVARERQGAGLKAGEELFQGAQGGVDLGEDAGKQGGEQRRAQGAVRQGGAEPFGKLGEGGGCAVHPTYIITN